MLIKMRSFDLKLLYIVLYINMDISGIPKHKPENHFNYTEDELAEKTLALEKMKIIYKDVPTYYADLVYDLCKNTPQDKIDEMKKRIDSTPFKYDYSNLQEELNKVRDNAKASPP